MGFWFRNNNQRHNLKKVAAQAEFDKDIFARLVDGTIIKSSDNITFILKDGTEVKAAMDNIAA